MDVSQRQRHCALVNIVYVGGCKSGGRGRFDGDAIDAFNQVQGQLDLAVGNGDANAEVVAIQNLSCQW